MRLSSAYYVLGWVLLFSSLFVSSDMMTAKMQTWGAIFFVAGQVRLLHERIDAIQEEK